MTKPKRRIHSQFQEKDTTGPDRDLNISFHIRDLFYKPLRAERQSPAPQFEAAPVCAQEPLLTAD